jgi:hypothetical protein
MYRFPGDRLTPFIRSLDDFADVDERAELTARAVKLGVNIDKPFPM